MNVTEDTSISVSVNASPQSLAVLAALAVVGLVGCAAPVEVATRVDADGSLERRSVQPVRAAQGRFQFAVPAPEAAGWDRHSVGLLWAEIGGKFAPEQEVPTHWRALLPDTKAVSTNAVRRSVLDYGLFRVVRFEESISNTVDRNDFRAARAELFALMLPLLDGWVDRMYADKYQTGPVKAYLRESLLPTIERVTERLYETAQKQPIDRPDWKEMLRQGEQPLASLGLKSEEGLLSKAGKQLARLWAIAQVTERLRKLDGTPLTNAEATAIVDQWEDPEWKAEAERVGKTVVAEIYGSRGAFALKVGKLVSRLTGVYGGPVVVLPKLAFHYQLELPGEVIATNGTRTSAATVEWRFFEHALFPAGLSMWAESVLLEPSATASGGGALPVVDAARAETVREPLRQLARTEARKVARVEQALRDCAAAGGLEPLRKLARRDKLAERVLAALTADAK